MTDYLVFVGPSSSLSTELSLLRSRLSIEVVADAVGKHTLGTNEASVLRAVGALMRRVVNAERLEAISRLSIWAYMPEKDDAYDLLWQTTGGYGWVEFVPRTFINKNQLTRLYVERRYKEILGCLHIIGYEIYNRRRRSLFPLPRRNFSSPVLDNALRHWYGGYTAKQVQAHVEYLKDKYQQQHTWSQRGHKDNNGLYFMPAKDDACHGMPHPTGTSDDCFLLGRYRLGASLYPGFHYDVSEERGNLVKTLQDCQGTPRDLRPERRRHINVFPNDHLLPDRGQ